MDEDPRLKHFRIGMSVRLKPGIFPHVKVREWEITCFGKDKILLRCRVKNYTLEVLPQDIEADEP
jgi:hypothetical protein